MFGILVSRWISKGEDGAEQRQTLSREGGQSLPEGRPERADQGRQGVIYNRLRDGPPGRLVSNFRKHQRIHASK